MKNIIIIILIFIVLPIFGQFPVNFDKEANLDKWVIQKSKIEKLKILDCVRDNQNLSWIFYSFEKGDSIYLDGLCIVDFDKDGISDILYYGYLGGGTKSLLLLKGLSGNKYIEIINLFGRLIEVSENDGFSPLSFSIYNYACCAGVINHIEKYVPVWNNSDFGYLIQYKYSFYYSVDIPKNRFDKPIGFKTINQKYNLRLNPYVNDTIILDHDEVGNIFAEYPKDSEGIAIAEQKDDSGKVWWFVMMKNNIKPNWSLYIKGDNNDLPAFYLGWISNSYVKTIY